MGVACGAFCGRARATTGPGTPGRATPLLLISTPCHPEELPEKHVLIAKATGVTAEGCEWDGADR